MEPAPEHAPRWRIPLGAKLGIGALLITLVVSFALLSRIHTGGQGNILVLTLVNINLILVVLLVLLLSRNLLKWMFEGQRRLSLRNRLVAAFLGFSLIPSVLLFVVASGLLTNSVDGWFSPQMERAMKGAVEVARERYRDLHVAVAVDAGHVAEALTEEAPRGDDAALRDWLARQQRAWAFSGLALRPGGDPARAIAVGEVNAAALPPEEDVTRTVPAPGGERVESVVPVQGWGQLVAERLIPVREVERLRRITEDYENFAQLAAIRDPIKEGYRMSFLVITLVILFSATWFGFYLARGITTPVQQLVEGARDVAAGKLDVKLDPASRDEVGELVTAFNLMISELSRNKSQITRANEELTASNRELEERRAHMEAILENAATGVIALDSAGRVTLFNRAAAEILRLDPESVKGRSYREAFRDMTLSVFSQFADVLRDEDRTREREVTLTRGGRTLTLQVNARRVVRPEGGSLGLVLVFDDLTELIRVQKEAAWREVAQRLAHEIKNPLTPIQLSVQRLRKRFSKEGEELPAVVEETTNTILEEVGGLKRLVDEFSQFARLPEPSVAPLSPWELIEEVATLYRQAYPQVEIRIQEADLGSLLLDRTQMRRVFTNLFENAIQAMGGDGRIEVTGHREGDRAEIRVADTGPGIDPDDRERIFQPYFSRRKGGTGLGLAIVQRLVEVNSGSVRVADNHPTGAAFTLSFPLS